MKSRIPILVALVFSAMLLPLIFAACGPSAPPAGRTIKIGGLFDLTGPMTPIGVSSQQGAIVAFEQAGYKVGDYTIQFIVEDSASDPPTALDKARKLVETDKVAAIIGPQLDPSVVGVSGYVNRQKVPQFATVPNSVALILDNDWTWMPIPPSSAFTFYMGIYLGTETQYKKMTAMSLELEAGHQFIEGINNGLKEKGAQIIQQQYFPFDTKDFSPYFSRLDKTAEALLIWAPDIFTQPLFTQLKEFGVKLPIFIVEGGGVTADAEGLMQKVGPLVQGMKLGQFWSPFFSDDLSKKYIEAFKKRWNRVPDFGTSNGFIDAQIIMEALGKTGGNTSPDTLAKALDAVSIDTIRGRISFTPDHVAINDLFITEIVKSGDKYIETLVKKYNVRADVVGGKFQVTVK